jgi:hypothetical protein
MIKIRLDGKEYEAGSQAHLDKLEDMRAASEAKVADLAKKLDETTAKLDAATTKLSKKEKDEEEYKARSEKEKKEKDEEGEKKMAERVRTRVRLFRSVMRLFGKDEDKDKDEDDKEEEKMDAMSDRELMVHALIKDTPEFKAEGRSDDYITARFDSLVEQRPGTSGSDRVVNAAEDAKREVSRMDADGNDDVVQKARQKNHDAMHGAWKGTPAGGNGAAK